MDPTAAVFRKRYDTFARQTIPCSHDRMTGKWKFVTGSKDSQSTQGLFLIGGQDENGFRQIHFARDLLHLFVADSFSFGKDRQRITAKRVICEHVELKKFVAVQKVISSGTTSGPPARAGGTIT